MRGAAAIEVARLRGQGAVAAGAVVLRHSGRPLVNCMLRRRRRARDLETTTKHRRLLK